MQFTTLLAFLAVVPAAFCAPSAAVSGTSVASGNYPPAQAFTGAIEVKNEQNKVLGFLAFDINNINGLVPQKQQAGVVAFNDKNEPFSLDILQYGQRTNAHVGGAGFQPLGQNSANIVPLEVVPHTPRGSGPVPPRGAESTIWSRNGANNNELTAQWVNQGGQRPSTQIARNPQNNEFFFTGDINAFNKEQNANAELVRFFFANEWYVPSVSITHLR